MKIRKLQQDGSHLIAIVLAVAVVGAIGVVGWRVMESNKQADDALHTSGNTQTQTGDEQQQTAETTPAYVDWSFNGEKWSHLGDAPECDFPLTIGSPMDISRATSVLYPGQMRGGDFKPHGGIGMDGTADNSLQVTAIRDAYLYRGSRYIEAGEVQHLFDFIDPCGIMYRLDHLAALSEEFAAYAEKLPAAEPDNSRTEKFTDQIFVKKGTVVATSVGYSKTPNAFFDLGVFDLRQPNKASGTDSYKTDQFRIADKEQSFYAVCWFDLLTGADKDFVKKLPPRGGDKESASDYCEN